eukprot:2796306-Rhodomonas_salina.1
MTQSIEMLQVHVDVKLAASDGSGTVTSTKDTLVWICVSVWRLCGDPQHNSSKLLIVPAPHFFDF